MTQEETWLLNEKFGGKKNKDFFADCARLHNGEPLAYLIGRIPFLGTTIFLDSRPLIPRTETEYWVEQVLIEIEKQTEPLRVLDLCAGSGCIGVAILHHIQNVSVDFVEIVSEHHTTIEKNLIENGIDPKRAHIFGGDLFTCVSKPYDYILSNPPYLDETLGKAEESVVAFEPREALYARQNGSEVLKHIIQEAHQYLTESGVLYLEHEPEQYQIIHVHAHKNGFIAESFPDQYDIARYTRLTRRTEKKVQQYIHARNS